MFSDPTVRVLNVIPFMNITLSTPYFSAYEGEGHFDVLKDRFFEIFNIDSVKCQKHASVIVFQKSLLEQKLQPKMSNNYKRDSLTKN